MIIRRFYESIFSSSFARQPPSLHRSCVATSVDAFNTALDTIDDAFLSSHNSNEDDGNGSGQSSPESASRGVGVSGLSLDKNIFLNDLSYGAFYPMQFVPPYYGITTVRYKASWTLFLFIIIRLIYTIHLSNILL
jgi:hypothetical protein